MKPVPFMKMSGVGNDFIIVDNRSAILDDIEVAEFARRVCARRISLGGDELMVIEAPRSGGDFLMRTFNPDGNEVKMCGNAARCVARYAYSHAIAGERMTIETLGGAVIAWVDGDVARVQLQITSPPVFQREISLQGENMTLHTVEISGSPHVVIHLADVQNAPAEWIQRVGAFIRYHESFPQGTNVNFVQVIDRHTLWQRTYERGVEGETLACGTGAAASSVISHLLGMLDSPTVVHVLGGDLSISFARRGGLLTDLLLGGRAWFVADGFLHPEAWNWA